MVRAGREQIKPLLSSDFGRYAHADGQRTAADVFDLAELCWTLADKEKWDGKRIATELGWSDAEVSKHKAIKEKLHPKAWNLARFSQDSNQGNLDQENSGKSDFPKGKWAETHLRAFISCLPYTTGDRATMRAQVKAIRELLAGDKLTAKLSGDVAKRYAWHTELAKMMTDTLVKDIGYKDRAGLLRAVRKNVYGKEAAERQKAAGEAGVLGGRPTKEETLGDHLSPRVSESPATPISTEQKAVLPSVGEPSTP